MCSNVESSGAPNGPGRLRCWVTVNGPPGAGFLLGWGREDHTGWWGFVAWTELVFIDDVHTIVACGAWVAARRLRPQLGQDYRELPRRWLPGDSTRWPVPDFGVSANPTHYYGSITGDPLPPPCGGRPLTSDAFGQGARGG
ncbi:MAG TPA: hypothetical protein VLJ59_13680 [Mycobacteriales bacterium]|nr:hypothetical protein [Mycobacteriales bacterium]